MSITLILNGKQRRKLHLPKQRLAWVGGILFTVLALSGGWLWQSWHQKMEALEVALAMAEQQKSTQGPMKPVNSLPCWPPRWVPCRGNWVASTRSASV